MSYDGTTIRIYIDGIKVKEGLCVQTIDDSASMMLLNDLSNEYWNGAIQGAAVWSRVLSDSEVLADKTSLTPNSTGLWGWWLLADGTDVLDRSGNNRHLTNHGTPTPVAGPGIPL